MRGNKALFLEEGVRDVRMALCAHSWFSWGLYLQGRGTVRSPVFSRLTALCFPPQRTTSYLQPLSNTHQMIPNELRSETMAPCKHRASTSDLLRNAKCN